MSVSSRYDKGKNILYASVEGELLPSDVESSLKEIMSSAEYPSDVATLWDLNALDFSSFDATLETMLIAIRAKSSDRGSAIIAIFAGNDLSYGVSRRYEILSEKLPQTIGVFRTFLEAENWLISTINDQAKSS